MPWAAADFLVAHHSGPMTKAGYVYRGLGLSVMLDASPKGKRPTWVLTHLGSGHAVCSIKGHVREAFPIATEIAECGDWDFDGLDGWRNRDPELIARAKEIIDHHSPTTFRGGGAASDDMARAVVMARA